MTLQAQSTPHKRSTISPFSTVSVNANSSCKRTLYVGPCTYRTDARSPVACSSGTNSNLLRVTSEVIQGTHLSVQLEPPYCGNSHKSCPCQLSATSSLPNQAFQTVIPKTPKGMGLGGLGPPRVSKSSQNQSRSRPESCCSNGSTCLHAVTWTWAKTVLIKHKIEVTDWMPFKECYWCIPPHMYGNVRAHIQEMLDIGAIQKLHSPWASTVILVQKKDSSLRLYTQLCL